MLHTTYASDENEALYNWENMKLDIENVINSRLDDYEEWHEYFINKW